MTILYSSVTYDFGKNIDYFFIPHFYASDETSFCSTMRLLEISGGILAGHLPGLAYKYHFEKNFSKYCLRQCKRTCHNAQAIYWHNLCPETTVYIRVCLSTLLDWLWQRTYVPTDFKLLSSVPTHVSPKEQETTHTCARACSFETTIN